MSPRNGSSRTDLSAMIIFAALFLGTLAVVNAETTQTCSYTLGDDVARRSTTLPPWLQLTCAPGSSLAFADTDFDFSVSFDGSEEGPVEVMRNT